MRTGFDFFVESFLCINAQLYDAGIPGLELVLQSNYAN
jgi:hypothetical protein